MLVLDALVVDPAPDIHRFERPSTHAKRYVDPSSRSYRCRWNAEAPVGRVASTAATSASDSQATTVTFICPILQDERCPAA